MTPGKVINTVTLIGVVLWLVLGVVVIALNGPPWMPFVFLPFILVARLVAISVVKRRHGDRSTDHWRD